MNKQALIGFAVGAVAMAAIDHIGFKTYQRRVVKQFELNHHGLVLAQVLIDVSSEQHPDIFLDERVQKAIFNGRFHMIVNEL